MVEVIFDIEMHHGGVFKHDLRMRYTSETVNVLAYIESDFCGWFDLEDDVKKLGYDGDLRFFYKVFKKDLENGLIWVQDDSGVKLIVDNYRKREEAHVYIEHLVDESIGLIEM